MNSERAAYDELCLYSLAHGGPDFIHQHVVDAFAAQDAAPADKPIRLMFALAGLFLHVERGFTGREVQLAHMLLARTRQPWPALPHPEFRGELTAASVLAAPVADRDSMIHAWCSSTWNAFAGTRLTIEQVLARNGITEAWSVRQR